MLKDILFFWLVVVLFALLIYYCFLLHCGFRCHSFSKYQSSTRDVSYDCFSKCKSSPRHASCACFSKCHSSSRDVSCACFSKCQSSSRDVSCACFSKCHSSLDVILVTFGRMCVSVTVMSHHTTCTGMSGDVIGTCHVIRHEDSRRRLNCFGIVI